MKVNWDEKVGIHSGEAFKVENVTLAIYEQAATDKGIKAVVAKCPSGALTIQEKVAPLSNSGKCKAMRSVCRCKRSPG